MMFLDSFLKEFHQSWFRYSKEPTFPYSGQYLKLLILNVFLAFKGDTPQSEHFHVFIMRFHEVYVFWRYHVAWSNMSQVMCTMPTPGAGIEWCDTSAGPKGQSTKLSLKSFLYFLLGADCASTEESFENTLTVWISFVLSLYFFVAVVDQIHVTSRKVYSKGICTTPKSWWGRKRGTDCEWCHGSTGLGKLNTVLRDFGIFFEPNHSEQFKFRSCSECMYVYFYVYVLSMNCRCSFLFL